MGQHLLTGQVQTGYGPLPDPTPRALKFSPKPQSFYDYDCDIYTHTLTSSPTNTCNYIRKHTQNQQPITAYARFGLILTKDFAIISAL